MNNGQQRSDTVYQSLYRAIIEQALKPGTRLPEDTIGKQFGVSRTVVRQALNQLQGKGLVEIRPNRGAFVAKPSLQDAHNTFEVRRCLEREVIRKLVERISVNGLDALEAHVRQEEKVKQKESTRSIRLAGEFHIILAELTNNHLLAHYVAEVVSRCSLILAVYGRPHSSDCAVDEHRHIIQVLRDGEVAAAIQIIDRHLEAVEARAQLSDHQPGDLKSILNHYAVDSSV